VKDKVGRFFETVYNAVNRWQSRRVWFSHSEFQTKGVIMLKAFATVQTIRDVVLGTIFG